MKVRIQIKNPDVLYESIREALEDLKIEGVDDTELESMNIVLEEFEIRKFKVKVVFKPTSKGRRRQVTAEITHPDGCNLKQRQIDAVVYKLLKKWGLVLF